MDQTKPKVLRRLKISEFSFVDAPASIGSDVLVWKNAAGASLPPPPPPARPAVRLAKLEADLASLKANDRVDEVYAALAKGDHARAGELLRDPVTYDAYRARLAGERWQAPVEVVKDEPDYRQAIREAVADGDHAELNRLVHLPEGGRQYGELLRAGDLVEAAAAAVAKRARTPADVPAAEVARWRERIRGLLKAKDQKRLDAARREGGAAFQAAWVAMSVAGEKMTF